ncbi:hypothetical protein LTS08_000429 [Lithohypha guttulata]|nr:hypothetical protein LTS08_000429 [Lithohypha guttulata]
MTNQDETLLETWERVLRISELMENLSVRLQAMTEEFRGTISEETNEMDGDVSVTGPAIVQSCAYRDSIVCPQSCQAVPEDPFGDDKEISIASGSAEDFQLNDFYNQVSPKRGFPYARSKRLTSLLLTVCPPIECDAPKADKDGRFWQCPTPISGRLELFADPVQAQLRHQWLSWFFGEDYEDEEFDYTPTPRDATVDDYDCGNPFGEGEIEDKESSRYAGWEGLPSPVTPLCRPSTALI